jgi:hypothetical protein
MYVCMYVGMYVCMIGVDLASTLDAKYRLNKSNARKWSGIEHFTE